MTDTSGSGYNLHSGNYPCCPWPEAEDVVDWALNNDDLAAYIGDDDSDATALQKALAAERSRMADRCNLYVVDPTDEANTATSYKIVEEIPPHVAMATVLYTARTYYRKDLPEGIATAMDVDAERLIANDIILGLA